MIALDVRSGEVRWRRPLDLADCRGGAIGTMYGDGVLTIFGVYTDGHYWQQYFQGELAGRRVTALAGKDGKLLWSRAAGYQVRPLIVGDKLIAEPLAFDLHTGKPCTRTNPITGAEEPWQFSRPGHHCGCSVASPDCLFFRSYCLGCYDLAGDFGTVHLGGQRPGCWINFIPANGLLLMPEASAGCTCPFPNRCNLAFEPVWPPGLTDRHSLAPAATPVRTQGFGCYSASGPATPVRRLAVALGAPGDRNDAAGQLWLGYPRPDGSLILPLDLGVRFCRGGRFRHRQLALPPGRRHGRSLAVRLGGRGVDLVQHPAPGAGRRSGDLPRPPVDGRARRRPARPAALRHPAPGPAGAGRLRRRPAGPRAAPGPGRGILRHRGRRQAAPGAGPQGVRRWEKGTGTFSRDQPSVGARPSGASQKRCLSPFPRSSRASR